MAGGRQFPPLPLCDPDSQTPTVASSVRYFWARMGSDRLGTAPGCGPHRGLSIDTGPVETYWKHEIFELAQMVWFEILDR